MPGVVWRGAAARESSRGAVALLLAVVLVVTLLPATETSAQSAPYSRGIDRACSSEAKGFDPFRDTTAGTHLEAIQCVAFFGVTEGRRTSAGTFVFDPRTPVTREQMASFIARTMNRVDGFRLPSTPSRAFPDSSGAHARNIDRLAGVGIVEGGADGRFNRKGVVTREQMASFVGRALEHVTGENMGSTDVFRSAGISRAHDDNVAKLAAVGVVQGQSGGGYGPTVPITRQEMASFLARALDFLVSSGFELTPETPAELIAAREGYHWPLCGRITSEYGPRWGRIHHGIDIAAPTGTPIGASRAGTVTFAGWHGGYGNLTLIDHGGGAVTAYAHQSRFAARAGTAVSRGQTIGYVGSTGNSTGPHLHLEIRISGRSVNPRQHLSGSPC